MTTQQVSISSLRSFNQQLNDPQFQTAKEVTAWMGAMQAQDYSMSKWAMGIRLKIATEDSINNEINSGRILRTHLLRPTWHFVSDDDIYWILRLTGPRIKASLSTRDKQLELTDGVYNKCNRILERSLRDNNHQTREELILELKRSKINVEENRASHIFMRAEIDGLICSGRQKNGKPTFAILGEWVPVHKKFNKDEALKELACRYFISHGPATINDFNWWSGLKMSDVKLALEYNKDILRSEVILNQTYWMAENNFKPASSCNEVFLLPSYDEFLISYRDRSASLPTGLNKKVISDNGIFFPTIMQNGQVIGAWKRNIKNNRLIITSKLFKPGTISQDKILLRGIKRYSDFIGKTIDFKQD